MTPTDALMVALQGKQPPKWGHDMTPYVESVLAALPEGSALVTTDSLAERLRVVDMDEFDTVGEYDAAGHAAAIIRAAKEAERE